jgi:GNAT superfamily N-acetyltransferase
MSGTFAAIFSFEASKKWIIREGLNGTSVIGSGASIASGLKKSRGLRKFVSWSLPGAPNASVRRVSFEIRAAREEEAEAIVPLYEWLFAPPGLTPAAWDERRAAVALRQAIASHDCCVLVAEANPSAHPAASGGEAEEAGGTLVGFCTAYQDIHSVRFGYRAWIEDLAVHPEHRSRGVGKALLDAAKAWARERGATHLELDSAEGRTDAHRFYEREGFDYRSYSFGWEL